MVRVAKRTEKLIREAAVLGFVQGSRLAGREVRIPRDAEVVRRVLLAAESFSDLYPTLSKVEPQTAFLLPPQWLLDRERQEWEYLREMMKR